MPISEITLRPLLEIKNSLIFNYSSDTRDWRIIYEFPTPDLCQLATKSIDKWRQSLLTISRWQIGNWWHGPFCPGSLNLKLIIRFTSVFIIYFLTIMVLNEIYDTQHILAKISAKEYKRFEQIIFFDQRQLSWNLTFKI